MYNGTLMFAMTFILALFFILFSSANGLNQTYFKVTVNHGFQNTSGVFKTVKPTSLLECSGACAQNDECRTALFNASDQSCALFKSCKMDLVPKTGSDVIQDCPADCSELPPGVPNGIYHIHPIVNGLPYETEVFCDMDGGGWTVIQRRTLSGVDFDRTFDEYKNGFGDKLSDHWLGNKLLHHILLTRNYKLRIEMEDLAGNVAFAEYDSFFLGNETNDFILSISGYSGNAGDSMTNPYCNNPTYFNAYHLLNGVKFSAVDRDNDNYSSKCASKSGWWLNWCACGNPNDLKWSTWNTSNTLKSAEMKIRI